MTEIKICGITNLEDALCAVASGANALGFIFHPESPRYLPPEQAKAIIRALPPAIATVGVFVNEEAERVREIVAHCGVDLIQLHGDESPLYCRAFPAERLLKAVSPKRSEDLAALTPYAVRAFLIDARSAGLYGGTGKQADWALAARLAEQGPLLLAGGLDEGNIAAALAAVHPQAVDLNSGVERAPGIKDHNRLRRICALIREASPPGEPVLFGQLPPPAGRRGDSENTAAGKRERKKP